MSTTRPQPLTRTGLRVATGPDSTPSEASPVELFAGTTACWSRTSVGYAPDLPGIPFDRLENPGPEKVTASRARLLHDEEFLTLLISEVINLCSPAPSTAGRLEATPTYTEPCAAAAVSSKFSNHTVRLPSQ